MKKLVRGVLYTAALLLPIAFSAVECNAQRSGRNPWALIARGTYNSLFFLKDSVVQEEGGMRVAWVRIEHKEIHRHGMAEGMSPEYNVQEVRFRFDCPGRRMLLLEGRERMGETIVHEHVAHPGVEWKEPRMGAERSAFGRVC